MDGLWIGIAIGVGLPIVLLWWVNRPKEPGEPVWPHKRTEAEIDELRRAAGLYMGPMPDDERRAFEKASNIVRARVLSRLQTGERINLRVVLDISVMVEAPEGAYRVDLKEPIPYKDLHRFEEGSEIDVYANPDDHTKVLLCDPEIAEIHRKMHENTDSDD